MDQHLGLWGDEVGDLALWSDETGFLLLWGDDGQPPEQQVEVDTHDGKPHKDDGGARRKNFRDRREALRATVEAAYERAFGELTVAAEPLTQPEVHALAIRLLPAIDAPGIQASLSDIERLLDEYQATLAAKRQADEDEEAALMLLLLG